MSIEICRSQKLYLIIGSLIFSLLLAGCSTLSHESSLSNSVNANSTVTVTSDSLGIALTEKPSRTFIPFVTRTKSVTPVPTTVPTIVHQKAETPAPHPDAISLSNVSQLKQVARLGNGVANSVAWSPDGNTIVVTSDIKIDFYDANTMELKFSLDDMRAGQIVFNPAGDRIAVTVNQDILILEADTGKLVKKLTSNITCIQEIAFSPDGNTLAGIGLSSTGGCEAKFYLEVWNIFIGEKLFFREGSDGATGISFSPDGKNLAIGSFSGTVLVDPLTGVENKSFRAEIYGIGFRSDGNLVIRTNNNEIDIQDPNSDSILKTLKVDGYYEFTLSPDGKILVEKNAWVDGKNSWATKFWDLDSGLLIQTINHQSEYKNVAFSPDSSKLAIVDCDSVVQIWDIRINKLLKRIEYSSEPTGLAFKPLTTASFDNPYSLAAGYDRGQVWLWDVSNQTILKRYEGHASTIKQVTFSPDGQTLVSSSDDYSTRIWLTDSGQLIKSVYSEGDVNMDRAGYRFDSQQMFTESSGLIRLWDTATWKVIYRWYGFTGAHFLGDRLIAYKCDEHAMVFLDQETNETYLPLPMPEVDYLWFRHMEFSPDGKYIAGGTQEGMIYIWDVEQKQLITSFTGHQPFIGMGDIPAIYDLAFSPFNSILVSAGYDGTLKIWNAQNGNSLQTFDFQGEPVQSLAFSSDGRYLAAGVEDGTIRIWGIAVP